ncbi:tRNA (adenosine(37)-N6)-threonylcarbamoyltransferase complex transferase subunit TsaD [Desulfobacterota bacterium AH_259_B03_O07]|nr:tRNA (adenosine(37)-N6)-threonylcarbamoyltransferase complex transferase subunit TsaD [Desulfobacterota bacterium AH_259_B03_O07]
MISLVLGVETSCDETAAAIIKEGKHVLSNIVASQIDLHKEYGGVVPELASRNHIEKIIPVIDEALNTANVELSDVEGIAVTNGPGLIGSLLVGLSTAKAISFGLGIPFIGVDHLEAHISAVHLERDVSFPFLGLIVSGGHTSLYLVNGYTDFKLLGRTRDDAAGEAFDKAAKLLGLSYPGGVEIDRVAKKGNRQSIKFPRPFKSPQSFDFSFSGIKTSLVYYLRKYPNPQADQIADICASYQEAIVETLVDKSLNAAKLNNLKTTVISGGVACNSRLRELATEKFNQEGISLYIPSLEYCTDNAAMIGALGYFKLKRDEKSELNLNPYSTTRPRYIRGKGLVLENKPV